MTLTPPNTSQILGVPPSPFAPSPFLFFSRGGFELEWGGKKAGRASCKETGSGRNEMQMPWCLVHSVIFECPWLKSPSSASASDISPIATPPHIFYFFAAFFSLKKAPTEPPSAHSIQKCIPPRKRKSMERRKRGEGWGGRVRVTTQSERTL